MASAAARADDILLAVTPFENLSRDPELDYLPDGVAEEILQALARRGGLAVVGRDSSFQFRGPDRSIDRIGRELGASHVLQGSVRRSGQTVRISAELVACADRSTVWAGRLERQLQDIAGVRDEIAGAVADALERTLAPGAAAALEPAAYDAYLRARAMVQNLVAGPATRVLLDEVKQRAPEFAPGWAAAADARVQMLGGFGADWRRLGDETARRLFDEACAGAARARALAPHDLETLRVQHLLEPVCPDWAALDRALADARARWPNDGPLHFHHGRLLLQAGRQTDALALLGEAYRLDPLQAASASAYASALRAVDRTREAVSIWSDLVRRFPTSPLPFFSLIFCLTGVADWDAIDAWTRPEQLARYPQDSDRVRNVLMAVQARRQASPDMRERLTQLADFAAANRRLPLSFAAVLAQFCDLDWLYGLIERTPLDDLRRPGGRLDEGDGTLEVLFLPEFHRLRSDPRFAGLCHRLGFADFWRQTDRWPDFAAEVDYDLKAECRRVAAGAPA
jgi:TolB-like protein